MAEDPLVKIIYAYEFDAADVNVQSGRPCSILTRLERPENHVVRAFPLNRRMRYLHQWKSYYYKARGWTYRPDREPSYLKSLARQIERRVQGLVADVLIAPGSHVVAELRTPHPKVFVADATFANVLDFYDSFTNCAPEFVRQGHDQDRQALANCAAAIYPSAWAAQTAITRYGAAPAKIHVIPFGGNLVPPNEATVGTWIDQRRFDRLRILFIGRDWYRKGGDTVLAACSILDRGSVPLSLDLVGVERVPATLPRYARLHGRLNKNIPEQRRQLESLLRHAHVLFVPSRAENYGMVFCEAAGFGVPSLASAVGGITAAVRHGQTGFTLPAGAKPEAFADILEELFRDRTCHQRLALASLQDYHARLSWDAFGRQFMRVLEGILKPPAVARTSTVLAIDASAA
jgi:glycosyltransferase involved in cell wall biosynthesis